MANVVCAIRRFRATTSASFSVLCDIYTDTGAGGDVWLTVATPLTSTVAQLNNAVIAAATTYATSNFGVTIGGGDKVMLMAAFAQ